MNYRTGKRFKAKVQGTPVEGKIYVNDLSGAIYLLQDEINGHNGLRDFMGYKFAWWINDGSTESLKNTFINVTDLQLLPDTDEPKKGDLVEVSDDEKDWTAKPRIYTGYQEADGHYLTDLEGSYASWKHIRLAKSPEQARREEAEKEAELFMKDKDYNPTIIHVKEALTEYIYKTKTNP